MNHQEVLDNVYKKALQETALSNYAINLPTKTITHIETIVFHSETNKAIVTVLVTLLTHKIVNKNQDIRYHQVQLENGFS